MTVDRKTFRSHLNFEVLAKLFFDLAEERYPSAEKMKQLVSSLVNPLASDPLENMHIKIAILSVMRDMVKEVSPTQLYRSLQHRDDLYLAIIEGLEDLEDELEELEEKDAEEEEEEAET
jgi:type III secretion protein W